MNLTWDHPVGLHVRDAQAILAAFKAACGPPVKDPAPPSFVLDLGAHIGAFSIACALGGTPVVIAVEADPVTAKWLRKNVELNRVQDRVTVIQAAVSSHHGVANLQHLSGGQSSICYGERLRGLGRVERVATLPFEGLVGLCPSWCYGMLKCDVEGAEWSFLDRPAEELAPILSRFDYLDIECHETANRDYFDGHYKLEDVVALRKVIEQAGLALGEPEPNPLMIRRARKRSS